MKNQMPGDDDATCEDPPRGSDVQQEVTRNAGVERVLESVVEQAPIERTLVAFRAEVVPCSVALWPLEDLKSIGSGARGGAGMLERGGLTAATW